MYYIDVDRFMEKHGFDKARKYGNQTSSELAFSYDTRMMYEFADMLRSTSPVCSEKTVKELEETVKLLKRRVHEQRKQINDLLKKNKALWVDLNDKQKNICLAEGSSDTK